MKKTSISIVLCGALFMQGAYAATIDSVVVSDVENSVLTISGTVNPDEKGVSVVVLKKGEGFTPGVFYGNDSAIHNAVINNDKYEVSFPFAVDEGVYSIYVSNCDEVYEFEYISKNDIWDFVEDLGNKNISVNRIYEELERYSENLGINLSFVRTESEEKYVAESLVEYASEIKANEIDGIKKVVALVEAELGFMNGLKNASLALDVNALLLKYSESAQINLDKYNELTENQKVKVCTGFVEAEYSNMKTFKNDFEKKVDSAKNTSGQGTGGSGSGGGKNNAGSSVSSSSGIAFVGQTQTEEQPGKKLLEKFKDLEETKWAWEPILFVVEKNIMNGFEDGTFRPNDTVTREQCAKIITMAFDLYNETLVPDFDDVDKDNWSASYVASAKENGIMMGVDDKNFGYGRPISRQDLCVVIKRAAEKKGINFENKNINFNDFENIKDYAKEAVSLMAGSNIINGMGDGNFGPEKYATRAQIAKIISCVLEKEAK